MLLKVKKYMIRSDHLSNIDQSILLKVRNMLFLVFLILGFIMATWIVRTPSIRDILNASIMQMGLVLLGFSIGSIAGIFSSQKITLKLGADRSITLGLCAALSGLITLSIGSIVSSIWIVSCGLGLIGAGIALSEVAVNFLGSHIERNLKTHVLTLIHACFSLGTVLGGVSGVILMAFNVDFIKHMLIVFALLCPITIYATTQLNNAPGSKLTNQNRQSNLIDTLRRDPQLIVIGFIVLAVALAEGTANDWLPLLIVDTYKVPEYFGSLIFIIFALTMTIGRFIGVRFLNTFNVATVMRVSSMIGALGILILVLSNNIYYGLCSCIMGNWGITRFSSRNVRWCWLGRKCSDKNQHSSNDWLYRFFSWSSNVRFRW